MNIYITYDENNEPTSILLANNLREAKIATAFMKQAATNIEEIDPESPQFNDSVAFLLTSVEANSKHDYGHRINGVDFRIWKRGI